MSIHFNQDTNLQALIDDGTIVSAVQIVRAGSPIALAPDRYHLDGTTLTIDLVDHALAGGHRTMLTNGWYQLQLDTSLITALDSSVNHLNVKDMTPWADGKVRYDFFRLAGDFNGDRLVSVLDRTDLMAHFGTKLSQSLYDYAYDLDGDRIINLLDYMAWLKRLGRTL